MAPHPYENSQNHVFNHVAVSVPDIEAATDWYMRHFGFRRIRPTLSADSDDASVNHLQKIYGNKLRSVKVAFLSMGNSVGFELFEFTDPPIRKPDLENWTLEEQYQRGGFFHICLTVPDPIGKCKEVCADGAAQVGETIPGFDENVGLYFRDPYGNVVELMSGNFEQILANTA
ncbi:hypothetical protein LTR17_009096 [Elasticomyces elasticus]|nr:hypothetical protein LTR17_009096 [Elasticomyces elasticus]